MSWWDLTCYSDMKRELEFHQRFMEKLMHYNSPFDCSQHGWRHQQTPCPTCQQNGRALMGGPSPRDEYKKMDLLDGRLKVTAVPSPYDHRRKVLIDYMKVKMDESDWHGVSDVANDLRELEAEERGRCGK